MNRNVQQSWKHVLNSNVALSTSSNAVPNQDKVVGKFHSSLVELFTRPSVLVEVVVEDGDRGEDITGKRGQLVLSKTL